MKQTLLKLTAALTVLCIGIAFLCLGPPGPAETAAAADTDRGLYIDFLGCDETPALTKQDTLPLTSDDVDKIFWVGVAVDNVHNLDLFTSGVYSVELAFEYDPYYIMPFFPDGSVDENADWTTQLRAGNLDSANSSARWSSSQYNDVVAETQADIDTLTDRENKSPLAENRADDGWKMCYVSISYTAASWSDARFSGLTDTGKQYLVSLPFRLLVMPDPDGSDPNPTVLSLVRGPEAFSIGAGATGTERYAAWEATVDDPDDANNLKNLFTFKGDISLFGKGGLTSMVAARPKASGETTEPSPYTLSQTKALSAEGFMPTASTYYLSVPNEVTQLRLDMTADSAPTVKANGGTVNVSATGDKAYSTALFNLNELDKTIDADGFSNEVIVECGGTLYTVYIRRLLKPKIELEPGNSPYGEIMRDDAIMDKTTAKQKFDATNSYHADYTPALVADKAEMVYTIDAWGGATDKDNNMDRNDHAIFAYEGTAFSDTGFKLTDSMGDPGDMEDVSRTIWVYWLTANDVNEDLSTVSKETFTFDYEEDGLSMAAINPSDKKVRPGRYELHYSYTDDYGGTDTDMRYIIVIPQLGDVNLVDATSMSDYTRIQSLYQGTAVLAPADIYNLMAYRVGDLNMKDAITMSDATYIQSKYQKGESITEFYRNSG